MTLGGRMPPSVRRDHAPSGGVFSASAASGNATAAIAAASTTSEATSPWPGRGMRDTVCLPSGRQLVVRHRRRERHRSEYSAPVWR